jgi:hypothetical protein
MRIVIDEDIPSELVPLFRAAGHVVTTIGIPVKSPRR